MSVTDWTKVDEILSRERKFYVVVEHFAAWWMIGKVAKFRTPIRVPIIRNVHSNLYCITFIGEYNENK